MARTVLIRATVIDPTTRLPVTVRLAGGGVKPYTHLGAEDWLAGVVSLPLLSAALGFDQNGWTGGTVPTTGAISFSPASSAGLTAIGRLFWIDGQIEVLIGDDEAATIAFRTFLKAKVAKQEVTSGTLNLTVSDMSGDLAKPLASARFAGTNGIEGDAAVEGRTKRRSFGRVFNVEGRVLNAADNIYEFGDPAFPLSSFDAVRDKGRAAPPDYVSLVTWQGTVGDTLIALRSSTPRAGGAVVAPSIACVKWWTQPAGPLTADIRGEGGSSYPTTAATIAAYIVASITDMKVSNAALIDPLRPAICGIHVDDANETAAQTLDRLLLGVSLVWIVDAVGGVSLSEFSFKAAPAGAAAYGASTSKSAAHAFGGAGASWQSAGSFRVDLISQTVTRKDVFRPVQSRRLGFQRNYRQHTDGEISEAIRYDDGTLIDALQPLTAGADNTAASDTGQTVDSALNADGTVKQDKVTTGAIATSAVQQTRVARLAADVSIAQNAIVTVASLTFLKEEEDSDVKVTFSGMFWSGDDLQFNCSVLVNDSVSYPAGQQDQVFDNAASKAKATISPFVYLDLPAGTHKIGFNVQNIESDAIALLVKAGSALEVLEIKKGAQ